MSKDFMRSFRDALFVVNSKDKKKVEEYLISIGNDWKTMLLTDFIDYIFKWDEKKSIPPPVELHPVVVDRGFSHLW